jgi:hypothetical protein
MAPGAPPPRSRGPPRATGLMLPTADDLVEDCAGFGRVLRAWEGGLEIRGPPAGVPVVHGPLPMDRARRFLFAVHALVQTVQPITVHRFYDAAGLTDPNASAPRPFVPGAARRRVPAGMLGGWWGPQRPELMLAGLRPGISPPPGGQSAFIESGDWRRFDTCVEATLLPGSLVYAGRTALHAEDTAFDTGYGYGIFPRGSHLQFLLVRKLALLDGAREYHLR